MQRIDEAVILVTGATGGIGKQTAHELAAKGATVIIHARTIERGVLVVEQLQRSMGSAKVGLVTGDFSTLDHVRDLASQVLQRYERLDVLINNAGVILPPDAQRSTTSDGFETTFAVNYLAPFLLTHLLRDRLRRAAPARIVNVSPVAHQHGRMHFDSLQGTMWWSPYAAYGQSKLALLLFTYTLAEWLRGSGVTVNALHPGGIHTKLLRTGCGVSSLVHPLLQSRARHPLDVTHDRLLEACCLFGVVNRSGNGTQVRVR